MTSGWDEELLYFPGGIRYEIRHGLADAPRWIDSYLSFERYGAKTATLAQSVGNQVEIESVDDEQLTLTNGSCAEYWLLVVAGTGQERPTPP